MSLVLTVVGFLALCFPSSPQDPVQDSKKAEEGIPDEPGAMLREARRRYSMNNVNGAIALLERLVDVVDPSNLPGRTKLGRAYVAAKRYGDAKEIFESVVRDDPDNVSAWCEFAELYCRTNQPDQSLAILAPILEKFPDSIDALTVKAQALFRKGEMVQSADLLQSVIDVDPDRYPAYFWLGVVASQQGHGARAIACFRNCLLAMNRLGLDPVYGIPACESLGEIYFGLGNYKNTIHWLEQVQGVTSNPFSIHYKLGVSHGMMFHYDLAQTHLEKALEVNSNDYQTRIRLAHILETQNLLEESLVHYRRAMEANPTDPHAHDRIGNVLVKLSRLNEAKESFKKSIDLGSFTASPFHLLAKILSDEKNYVEAISCLEQGIALDPLHVESYYLLSRSLMKTGKPEDKERSKKVGEIFQTLLPKKGEIAKFQSMLEASPNQVDAWASLAETLASIGEYDECQKYLEKALKLNPNHFTSRMVRGLLFHERNMGDKGRNDLMMARELARMAITQLEAGGELDEIKTRRLAELRGYFATIEAALKDD